MVDPSRGVLTPPAPPTAAQAGARSPRRRPAGDTGRHARPGAASPLVTSPFATEPLTAPARRAQRIARDLHHGQSARHGGTMFDHVQRVALRVPPSARAVAFLHDACERSGVWAGELAVRLDLDEDESEALVLLTKRTKEHLLRHARRVARAPRGPARELALLVLTADLEDHAARSPGGPEAYAAARAVVAEAQGGREAGS